MLIALITGCTKKSPDDSIRTMPVSSLTTQNADTTVSQRISTPVPSGVIDLDPIPSATARITTIPTRHPPTPSLEPTGSSTPMNIPSATATNISPTATSGPCNLASGLTDLSIPAGTQIFADQTFRKTWGIQNISGCNWTSSYKLIQISGSLIYPSDTIKIGKDILAGELGQVSIDVWAPLLPGAYDDSWNLTTDNGQIVTDENGNELTFSISIIVPPAQIRGHILRDGVPVGQGTVISLEDAANQTIASTTTLVDSSFTLTDIPISDQGYYVVFSQSANQQFEMEQVLSWLWVGPIVIQDGKPIQLADIDISNLGFRHSSPLPDAGFSAVGTTSAMPVIFQWTPYPEASDYWVDLVHNEDENLWNSQLIAGEVVTFDGTLRDGTHIQPDEYWWAVGARSWLGPYQLIAYTYLSSIYFVE